MQKERITDKEAICIFILFVIGSSLIIGGGGGAKNDAWIATLVGFFMVVPMLLIFSRIISIFPGKDLFDILEVVFGKIIGKIFAILYIWYAFHLGALVLRNFGEFVNTVAMPETPMFIVIFSLGLTCIFAVKFGIEVIGRTCAYFIPIVMLIIVAVQTLAIPEIKIEYLKPILGAGLMPVFKFGFSVFSFPFAETVLFIGVFSALKTNKSSFRVYFGGMIISVFILTWVVIRNIGVLGNMLDSFNFPSYQAVSRIKIGSFLQRIEVTVAFVFIFGVFVKSSICLLVACRGIAKTFNLKDYRAIVIQIGLLMIYFAYTVYKNTMDMNYWAFKVYPYYAFPFQVIFPVIIWILAEIKARKKIME